MQFKMDKGKSGNLSRINLLQICRMKDKWLCSFTKKKSGRKCTNILIPLQIK